MAFKDYSNTLWIFDKVTYNIDQRACTDDDFTNGTTPSDDTWDSDASDRAKKIIKDKHLMRRVVEDIYMWKKIDGAKFNIRDFSKYYSNVGKQRPPQPALPWNDITGNGATYPLNSSYLLISIDADIQADAGALLRGHWQYYYPWTLTYVANPIPS